MIKEYFRPSTLEQAISFLHNRSEETTILAGGTDIMVDVRSGELSSGALLDISCLPEIKHITFANNELSVGAGVTLSEIQNSGLIRTHAPSLNKCAKTFASQQIRNIATIGGNVAHCSPGGDTLPPLLIHNARAVLAGVRGEREVPVSTIATGPYSSSLPTDEIIVRFILKPANHATFFDFQKIGRRKALAVARISMAAMATTEPDGKLSSIAIALGSCSPTPCRMSEVENFLAGKQACSSLLHQAAQMIADQIIGTSGKKRASAVYKEPAIKGLLIRLLQPLIEDAKTSRGDLI